MQISLQYTYLIGTFMLLLFWLILFIKNKEYHKRMLQFSLFLAIYGMVFEYFWWSRDWWHPQTLTGTRIGIEDFLLGFSGGLFVFFYPILFKKRIYKMNSKYLYIEAILILVIQSAIMFTLINLLGHTSAFATIITYIITASIIFIKRKDLFLPSVISASLMTLLVIPLYILLFAISPTFLLSTWQMNNISGILFLGIPIEDPVFFYLGPLFFSAFYYYFTNERFEPNTRHREQKMI